MRARINKRQGGTLVDNLAEVIACIKKHRRFLISAHTNPEGDALGSELAFYRLVKALKKEAYVVNEDKVPLEYGFFPDIDKIRLFNGDARKIDFDCFVLLDCSDKERCGEVGSLAGPDKAVLNIDHHISNRYFGKVNWVEPYASSASEMVYRLFKSMRIPIDKKSALLLYVGIMTDTGSFRYSNTSAFTHLAAADLMRQGLDVRQIYKSVYENIPYRDMKLLSGILPGMKRQAQGKVVWFKIKREVYRGKKVTFDLSEHILSFARAVKGIEVAVIFKENLGNKNEVRINFRSQGKVDVNKVASFFGGGGHKSAAGCTVSGNIDDICRRVLARIKSELNKI
jgi:phosphoesterase RecJ-like protein